MAKMTKKQGKIKRNDIKSGFSDDQWFCILQIAEIIAECYRVFKPRCEV